jgi:hypothetical protein
MNINDNFLGRIKKILSVKKLKNALGITGSIMSLGTMALIAKEHLQLNLQIRENQVYTLEQAALVLRITPADMKELVDREEIPYKIIGSQYRFLGKNLINFLS